MVAYEAKVRNFGVCLVFPERMAAMFELKFGFPTWFTINNMGMLSRQNAGNSCINLIEENYAFVNLPNVRYIEQEYKR